MVAGGEQWSDGVSRRPRDAPDIPRWSDVQTALTYSRRLNQVSQATADLMPSSRTGERRRLGLPRELVPRSAIQCVAIGREHRTPAVICHVGEASYGTDFPGDDSRLTQPVAVRR